VSQSLVGAGDRTRASLERELNGSIVSLARTV
jgi:hypothetical protein